MRRKVLLVTCFYCICLSCSAWEYQSECRNFINSGYNEALISNYPYEYYTKWLDGNSYNVVVNTIKLDRNCISIARLKNHLSKLTNKDKSLQIMNEIKRLEDINASIIWSQGYYYSLLENYATHSRNTVINKMNLDIEKVAMVNHKQTESMAKELIWLDEEGLSKLKGSLESSIKGQIQSIYENYQLNLNELNKVFEDDANDLRLEYESAFEKMSLNTKDKLELKQQFDSKLSDMSSKIYDTRNDLLKLTTSRFNHVINIFWIDLKESQSYLRSRKLIASLTRIQSIPRESEAEPINSLIANMEGDYTWLVRHNIDAYLQEVDSNVVWLIQILNWTEFSLLSIVRDRDLALTILNSLSDWDYWLLENTLRLNKVEIKTKLSEWKNTIENSEETINDQLLSLHRTYKVQKSHIDSFRSEIILNILSKYGIFEDYLEFRIKSMNIQDAKSYWEAILWVYDDFKHEIKKYPYLSQSSKNKLNLYLFSNNKKAIFEHKGKYYLTEDFRGKLNLKWKNAKNSIAYMASKDKIELETFQVQLDKYKKQKNSEPSQFDIDRLKIQVRRFVNLWTKISFDLVSSPSDMFWNSWANVLITYNRIIGDDANYFINPDNRIILAYNKDNIPNLLAQYDSQNRVTWLTKAKKAWTIDYYTYDSLNRINSVLTTFTVFDTYKKQFVLKDDANIIAKRDIVYFENTDLITKELIYNWGLMPSKILDFEYLDSPKILSNIKVRDGSGELLTSNEFVYNSLYILDLIRQTRQGRTKNYFLSHVTPQYKLKYYPNFKNNWTLDAWSFSGRSLEHQIDIFRHTDVDWDMILAQSWLTILPHDLKPIIASTRPLKSANKMCWAFLNVESDVWYCPMLSFLVDNNIINTKKIFLANKDMNLTDSLQILFNASWTNSFMSRMNVLWLPKTKKLIPLDLAYSSWYINNKAYKFKDKSTISKADFIILYMKIFEIEPKSVYTCDVWKYHINDYINIEDWQAKNYLCHAKEIWLASKFESKSINKSVAYAILYKWMNYN